MHVCCRMYVCAECQSCLVQQQPQQQQPADCPVTYFSVTIVTGSSVIDVPCWRAGAPTPTLAIGSVAALLKATRVQSLLQHLGQGLSRTAGLVQHPGQGLPRTAGPVANCQGEMFRVCHVGFGCFASAAAVLHSCTMSHHACVLYRAVTV